MKILKHSTIKNKVAHVGEYHVEKSRLNPVDQFPRVRRALRALKRKGGGPVRKFPAGPPVIRQARYRARAWFWKNRLFLRATLCTGYAFLLRSSEYLSRGKGGWDEKKVVRGRHIVFRRDGRPLEPSELALTNEVALMIPGSKTDQEGQGVVLVHHLADEEHADLCIVRALRDACLAHPERLREEKDLPFFRWSGGAPITRDQIRRYLGDAGEELGYPRARVGTNSLRVGGATSIFQATGGNKTVVQRLGR